jgi:outer membrane protein OmpA-like peptidoglycan-associated protein
MTRFKTSLMLGAAALALPAAANAQSMMDGFRISPEQTVRGLYVGAGAGLNLHNNQRLSPDRGLAAGLSNLGINGRGTAIFEPGFVGVASIGYGFGYGLRAEIEGSYRENELEKVRGFPGSTLSNRASGLNRTYGVMGNLLYDFRIPGVPWFVPYVGAGAGYMWREQDQFAVNGRGGAIALRSRAIEGSFAYQGIAGAAFPIRAVPGLAVTAEYRYLNTLPERFNTRAVATATGAGLAGGTLKSENQNHSVLVGLRYAFNTPRPAPVMAQVPPAAPAAPVARTYLVFFDWDRADLTDRARQIIGDAAQNARNTRSTRIEVSGHADRSGTPQYNQRLSQRRAEAVAAELVRQGVARNEIGVQAFGESRPLVPTADNVREPQNRRVEIVLR